MWGDKYKPEPGYLRKAFEDGTFLGQNTNDRPTIVYTWYDSKLNVIETTTLTDKQYDHRVFTKHKGYAWDSSMAGSTNGNCIHSLNFHTGELKAINNEFEYDKYSANKWRYCESNDCIYNVYANYLSSTKQIEFKVIKINCQTDIITTEATIKSPTISDSLSYNYSIGHVNDNCSPVKIIDNMLYCAIILETSIRVLIFNTDTKQISITNSLSFAKTDAYNYQTNRNPVDFYKDKNGIHLYVLACSRYSTYSYQYYNIHDYIINNNNISLSRKSTEWEYNYDKENTEEYCITRLKPIKCCNGVLFGATNQSYIMAICNNTDLTPDIFFGFNNKPTFQGFGLYDNTEIVGNCMFGNTWTKITIGGQRHVSMC